VTLSAHPLNISTRLEATCRTSAESAAWLERLPESVDALVRRWELTLGAAIDVMEGSCSWVAPVTRADGTRAVLKLAMPHFEGRHEIDGLRFWSGNPTVQLLESDDRPGALLLERCEPGTPLSAIPEPEQDREIARLLRHLWRAPPPHHPFRPLRAMLTRWADEAKARRDTWHDPALVEEGLRLFRELPDRSSVSVLLATDLHAGNVLRAERKHWLVIDPKPFVGDPAYDATQHLLNCRDRLFSHPVDTIRRFAELLELNHERVRLWTFARLAIESSGASSTGSAAALARRLAP
jgi:streptomycin 6-kinase